MPFLAEVEMLPATLTHRRTQQGQAMVEYAILLVLIVTLVMGGIELAMMTFNSNRIVEATKTASKAWVTQKSTGFPAAGSVYTPEADLRIVASQTAVPFNVSSTLLRAQVVVDGERYTVVQFINAASCAAATDCIMLDRVLPAAIVDGDAAGSIVVPSLGDHSDASLFDRPTCSVNDGDGDGDFEHSFNLPSATDYFLLNPKALDITDCVTPLDSAALDDFRNRLPPLNQALYPQMFRACFDDASGYTLNCDDFDAGNANHRILLKMPGRIMRGVEATYPASTRFDQDMTVLSLLHYEAGTGWTYCELDNPAECYADSPLPAMEIGCGAFTGTGDRANSTDFPVCNGPVDCPGGTCDIRVVARYRHYMNGLLLNASSAVADAIRSGTDRPNPIFTYWSLGVDPDAEEHIDFRGNATDTFIGTELARGFGAGGPALKGRKDFRGCYQTAGTDVINCN